MQRISLLLLSALALPICLAAQNKNYTMAEATNGMGTTLATKGLKQVSWQPETNNYTQVLGKAWLRTNAATGRADTLLSLASINTSIYGRDSLKALPTLSWIDKDYCYFYDGGAVHIFNASKGTWQAKPIQRQAQHIEIAAGTQHIAYVQGNDIWINNNTVTRDNGINIINGKAVHRDEFGITKGLFFSPKGNYLAYYKMDQSMVADYPVVDWSKTPAKTNTVKYPMAGGTSHHVSVWVYHPESKRNVQLNIAGPADQYLTCVSWSPDEQFVFVAILNRGQDRLALHKFDINTGQHVGSLLTEQSDKYVQPQHPMYFLPGSTDQFVWHSQQDGYMHLYLYNTAGKLIRQLTKGPWVVNEILGTDAKKKELLFSASKESAMERNSYAVNWETGHIRRLDNAKGYHSFAASSNGQYLYDVYSNATTPKKTMLLRTDGKWSKTLMESANTLAEYNRPEVRELTLKATDGTDLYAKMILPTGFDAGKKYPVIVYLYNGPNVQLLKNSFPACGNLWYEYLAQHGYIVFTMDGRGSSNRGLKFEQATFGQLGTVEINDQMQGVDYLTALPYVDASRMGIHGWSYGGFMTTSIMLRKPNVFKVGVAGGPVMDWKMYEIMYTERYMNTPQENPKGYEDANLLTKTQNLKGKLLLIHGTDDDVVVWQHSVNFVKKCVDNNIPIDYFVYPGHAHNVRGKDRVHLMQKITDYFDLYLKP